MATVNVATRTGLQTVVDKRHDPASADSPLSDTTFRATKSNAAMDAQLKTLDATQYTDDRLNLMSANDKLYALRLAYDSGAF